MKIRKITEYAGGILIAFVVLIGVALYLLYQNNVLNEQKTALEKELSKKTFELSEAASEISSLNDKFAELEKDKNKLQNDLSAQLSKMNVLQEQVKNVIGTVGVLDKLSKTDKELLQKYSKVYFLNENYIPEKLVQIDEKYTYNKKEDKWIHAKVWPYLKKMLDDANRSGVDILVGSAYRSFETQAQLKSRYSMSYGTGANRFSADQGYSEHQLGTTVDFTTPDAGGDFSAFKNSDAYKWLEDNAYRYGFTLSYPERNGYYIFEPWHWRFVGVKLAERLYRDEIYFYDLSQREIDEYLVYIFD